MAIEGNIEGMAQFTRAGTEAQAGLSVPPAHGPVAEGVPDADRANKVWIMTQAMQWALLVNGVDKWFWIKKMRQTSHGS
jgi:hypothetical protein